MISGSGKKAIAHYSLFHIFPVFNEYPFELSWTCLATNIFVISSNIFKLVNGAPSWSINFI